MNLQVFKTFLSQFSAKHLQNAQKTITLESIPKNPPGTEISKTIDKVDGWLNNMPGGGSVEMEEEITVENDPQASLKINAPQTGVEASASKNQKYTKKTKFKITKL
jgi:hypothetical protein